MKENSRIDNVIKNFKYGVGSQVISTLISFVSKTVFIKTLGEDFLGISGLYTSILSVLSLAELGIGNIIIFSLYKPVAKNDKEKIAMLVVFFKKIYLSIAAVILFAGICLIPFLDNIINLEKEVPHLVLYYILYLLNSALSYLFVYKTSVLRADQKQYLISFYTILIQFIASIVQIYFLFISRNFTIYLIIQIIFTFLTNYILSRKAERLYPYINNVGNILPKEDRKRIFIDTKSMMSYKIGGVLLNSTDNLYISMLVNTVSVGYYSNYYTLQAILNKIINMVYEALYTSVGNLNAGDDKKKQENIFNVLILAFTWIGCFFTVGFSLISSDIVRVWIGENYVLPVSDVLALSLNFYLPIILYPIWMFRNTTGLFKETENILFITAFMNLILSYFGGKIFGLSGIILATSISRLSTSFWYEAYVLYRKLFNKSCLEYLLKVGENILITIVCIVFINKLNYFLKFGFYWNLILKFFICIIIPNLIMLIRHYRTNEFIYLLNIFKKKFKLK